MAAVAGDVLGAAVRAVFIGRRCRNVAALFAMVLLMACNATPRATKSVGNGTTDRVLVVINDRSPASSAVGEYYMQRRAIVPTHVVHVDMSVEDEVGELEFRSKLAKPVRDAIDALPVRIDFIVLTKGVPLRLENRRGYSVDAQLAGMNLPIPSMVGLDSTWLTRYRSPYFNSQEPFNSDKFGMYLVTRLDCSALADCMALVDRSIAAQPVRGPFFFDASGSATSDPGYRQRNDEMNAAALRLKLRGLDAVLDTSELFLAPATPVMGYMSWGSNDAHFNEAAYHAVRFLPGALAETFVSTSARTFGPPDGGQSRIADLVAQGVTGVKGYVSEPYTVALSNSDILFDRYLRGFTLAESFYAASRMVLWKDVIIGDPLCAPYAMAR